MTDMYQLICPYCNIKYVEQTGVFVPVLNSMPGHLNTTIIIINFLRIYTKIFIKWEIFMSLWTYCTKLKKRVI
jgi:hypothetical protein